MATLLCGMTKLRPAGRDFDLTSSLPTSKPVFETVATCMAGLQTHDSSDTEHQVCNCESVEDMDRNYSMPPVPHSSYIKLYGHCPYALVDTGASPNLVKTSWLAKVVPDWQKRMDKTYAARTTFKLANGGRSAAPKGTVELPIEMGGVCMTRSFWVLDELTMNMRQGQTTRRTTWLARPYKGGDGEGRSGSARTRSRHHEHSMGNVRSNPRRSRHNHKGRRRKQPVPSKTGA
jgi:hypothetical protein